MRAATCIGLLMSSGHVMALPGLVDGGLVSSTDGTCGPDMGYTCLGSFFGNCCGSDGYCGSEVSVCGAGCQPDFGFCQSFLLGAASAVASVAPHAASVSCPSDNTTAYYASNGDTYSIECGIDHHRGNLPGTGAYVPSLDACIALCSNTTNCVHASWVKGSPNGACYLKSTVGKAFAKERVWGGRLIAKAPAVYTSVVISTDKPGKVTSSKAVSTVSASAPSYVTAQPTGTAQSFCPSLNSTVYIDSCGAKYIIECGINHSGSDISGNTTYQPNLGACMGQCSKNEDCVAVSWVKGSPNGACYLKSKLGVPSTNAQVYGARQISACGLNLAPPASPRSSTSKSAFSSSNKVSLATKKTTTVTKNLTITKGTKKSTATSIASSTRIAEPSASTKCTRAVIPTGDTLPGCTPCQDQPGTGKFCGYDINTDWNKHIPKTCRVVYYELDIANTIIAPDGIPRSGLLINGQMPGPAIHASWGDTVVVKVNNKMQNNGTSIHFHGIRQLNNNINDGVTSITQCPVAPGNSMTYVWVAENYGTSWYHSHFSIQTWEGVFGPMIIDGPHSQLFDIDLGTFTLQDWTHATVDSMYDLAQNATPIPGRTDGATYGGPQTMDNGLINGVNVWGDDGNANQTGRRIELNFTPGKSHLLRLINTAIQSSYKFSIDGHSMTVIAADFVPITPYNTDVLAISIGQRYNVIVKANAPPDNYWMRADNQESCSHTKQNHNIKAIVRYTGSVPAVLPTSTTHNYTDSCLDEPMASLKPVVPLNVGPPDATEGTFDIIVAANDVQLYKWYLSGNTFMSRYDDPPLLDVVTNSSLNDYPGDLQIDLPKRGEMIYLIVESPIPLPHPFHLHGHDFWILAAGEGSYSSNVTLQLQNPPRRDSATMPGAGYLVVAWETDNPGFWLFHCHIGWHTSMGLALTFNELQDQIISSGGAKGSCELIENCRAWSDYATKNNVVVLDSGV